MSTAPYDNLELVLNTSRARINDMIVTAAGQTLTDNSAFTLTMITAAWRRLQSWLVSWGYVRLQREVVLLMIPGIPSPDPMLQAYIGWLGYFNGVTLAPTPVLPQDLIWPLEVSERPSAQTAALAVGFIDMDFIPGTMLPAVPKLQWNGQCQWREDRLCIPGALQQTDMRILYASFLSDFVANAVTPFIDQPVPIMRCLDPFASLICSEFCAGRNDDVAYFDQQAMTAAGLIWPSGAQQGGATQAGAPVAPVAQ